MVIGFTQGVREELFTHYRLEIAPSLWTLTRKAKSCIFQQQTVTDILKTLFTGLTVDYTGYRNLSPHANIACNTVRPISISPAA